MKPQVIEHSNSDDDFEQWVSPHLLSLRRLATAYAGPVERDDLLQDSLARAWAKWSSFDSSRGSPSAWLHAILFDQARGRWRRRKPSLTTNGHVELEADETSAGMTSIDVRRAIARLPRRQRETVVLFYYVDLPITEVAQLLKCSVGTVKSALHDARARLATELNDYER